MATPAKSFRELIGIPPSAVSVNDSTLIIIDAQNEYADGHLATVNVSESRKAISTVLEKYRKSTHGGKNIVHVVHVTPPGAPVFTSGTALSKEFEELTPAANEKVVEKNYPNSFAKTDLTAYLEGLGAVGKKIVLVGYMAHVCVSTTARAGAELGYDVVIVTDAVGDRDIPGVAAGQLVDVVVKELADAFATTISSSEVQA
jgi:nicotinamidase-related amidase